MKNINRLIKNENINVYLPRYGKNRDEGELVQLPRNAARVRAFYFQNVYLKIKNRNITSQSGERHLYSNAGSIKCEEVNAVAKLTLPQTTDEVIQ